LSNILAKADNSSGFSNLYEQGQRLTTEVTYRGPLNTKTPGFTSGYYFHALLMSC